MRSGLVVEIIPKFSFLTLLIFGSQTAFAVKHLDDPTKPLVRFNNLTKSTKSSVIKKTKKKKSLTATFIKRGKRQAIIDDKLFELGDIYSGRKIISIHSDRVILRSSKGTSQLKLINQIKTLKNP